MPELAIGSRRDRRPRKGDLRAAAILDAAEALLGERGYAATTVEDIARGAGITRPSLYFYFDSKQAVMTAVVERTLAHLEATQEELTGAGAEPGEAIAEGLAQTARLWREHTAVMRFAAESAHVVPEAGVLWNRTLVASHARVEEILVRGGAGDGPVPARRLAEALVAMTERSFWNLHSRRHTRREEAELIETLSFFYTRAIDD